MTWSSGTKLSDSFQSCKIPQLKIGSIVLNRSCRIRGLWKGRRNLRLSRTCNRSDSKSLSDTYLLQLLHFQWLWWVTSSVNHPKPPGILESASSQGSQWSQDPTHLWGHISRCLLCSHGCPMVPGESGTLALPWEPWCPLRWVAQGRVCAVMVLSWWDRRRKHYPLWASGRGAMAKQLRAKALYEQCGLQTAWAEVSVGMVVIYT